MKKTLVILTSIFLALSAGFLFAQQEYDSDYRVGAKDLLVVSVFGQPEMNWEVRVSENGVINLPFIGNVNIDGMTQTEVGQKVASMLEEKILQNAQVTVFIKEHKSNQVSVMGAVPNPGPYDLLGRMTLMQVIAEAGGLTEQAGKDIVVLRQLPDGASTSLKISIDELVFKGDAKLNIPLKPGDIINIPVDTIVHVYVFGQVRQPGALQIKKSHIPTLLQAIAQAGGFSERASKGGVLIKRVDENGKEVQIKVNVKDIIKGKKNDIQLQENDTVFVPESIF